MTHIVKTAMSPLRGGIQSRTVVTLNQLQRWRFVGTNRATIGNEERGQEKTGAENPNEKSQWYTVTEDIKEEASSGQDKVQEMTGEVPTPVKRKVEDGILVVVPARIYGKQFRALIGSEATRCFVSPNCVHIAGLRSKNRDTFLELGNGTKVLSRAFVPEVPVVVASNTSKIDLTVCCGGLHHPAVSFIGSQNRTRRHTRESRVHQRITKCATSQPHI